MLLVSVLVTVTLVADCSVAENSCSCSSDFVTVDAKGLDPTINEEWSFYVPTSNLLQPDRFVLKLEQGPPMAPNGFFLYQDGAEVVVANDPYNSHLLTYDLLGNQKGDLRITGKTEGGPGVIVALCKLKSGTLLGLDTDTVSELHNIWRYDGSRWSKVYQDLPWLGTQSVAESGGAVIIAQYNASTVEQQKVIRSIDDGQTWQDVMVKRSLGDSEPEIRHFHVVQADPFHPGDVYLFSGDIPNHCRSWISRDNGATWQEVTDVDGDEQNSNPVLRTQSLQRTTFVVFTPEGLWWVTDDTLSETGSRLVFTVRPSVLAGDRFDLKVKGVEPVSRHAMRVAIKSKFPAGHLLISENVADDTGVDLVFVTANLEVVRVANLPIKSYFTSSVSALEFAPAATFLARGTAIKTMKATIFVDSPVERPVGVPVTGLGGLACLSAVVVLIAKRRF